MKETSTLENVKEDQSKYCHSYPTRPVLDMKWENCDIFIVGANIPKFSKLDTIVTLSRFNLFFDDVLVDTIVGYTNLEKADISFEMTNENIRLFLRMLLLSGCHRLPHRKIYWGTTPDTSV